MMVVTGLEVAPLELWKKIINTYILQLLSSGAPFMARACIHAGHKMCAIITAMMLGMVRVQQSSCLGVPTNAFISSNVNLIERLKWVY